MGVLSHALERRSSVAPSISLSSGDPALAGYFGGGTLTNSAQNVNANTALKVSTVYACVHRKASTLAMIPLETMRKLPDGGHEAVTNHRTYRQLNSRPNPWQTSFEWRMMGQTHKMLRGNFYNLIRYYPGRGVNDLIPLHPDRVWPFIVTPNGSIYYMYDNSPTPPPGSKLFYQYFHINGESEIYDASEILHIRGLSDNGIVGKTAVKVMAESIGLAMAMEEQGSRLFENGAQISKVFKHPKALGDEGYDRLKKQLDEYTGVRNSHKTILLEDGMEIESISMTKQDSQFIESRKFQVEDICSFLDVPMMLIHRSGDKNQTFASAEVINQMFITYNMQPEFENWEQRLKSSLLFDNEQEYYFCFDFDAIMRGDSTARAAYYKSRFDTGSITPNDIKRKEGESPYDNEESNLTYLTSGTMPAKLAGQQFKPKTQDKPDNKIDNKPEVTANA